MKTTDSVAAVRLQGVTRTFGQGLAAVAALRGVDLEFEPNQLVMIAGPSGCGKTTLMSIISGMLRPTSGQVAVCGLDWSALRDDEKTRRRGEMIGYVFQQYQLVPTLTVVLNVAVPLLARGVSHREALRRAADSLAAVGLGDRLNAMPRELSGGMQQRVAVARALVGQPRLLVCDEPTANLDAETGQSLIELLHRASRSMDDEGRPRSVLIVTHDYRVLRFADLIFQMEDGQVSPASPDLLMRVWHAALIHDHRWLGA